ncbi:unnamed protein product [Cylindrotheca closterium]|uniref:ATP-dependent DNA ligase family profile domain-containing protein n=1 Tax=Cylindrotheca closterium TaxID=2856 RepID=A0AAD2FVE0_9STRA|nr:unnamed protein product [Cylindrotheca closterium]
MSDVEQVVEEPVGEGEASVNEDNLDDASVSSDDTVEPDCSAANMWSFALICSRMETLYQLRRGKNKKGVKVEQKYEYIMPKKLIQATKGQSLYPLLRLYCPDIDNKRFYNMKESQIATAYINALSLGDGSTAKMLKNYTDSQHAPPHLVGDLSLVVEQVMKDRRTFPKSKMRLQDINSLLDELAGLKKKTHHHNHQWREGSQGIKPKKNANLNDMREKWLKKVIDSKKLSPLEHKWLVRIIMKKPEFGMRSMTILKFYSRYAPEIMGTHNSLLSLCNKLANPEYEKNRRQKEEEEKKANQGICSRWDPQTQPVVLRNMLSPMLSSKLTFEKAMAQVTANHTEYLKGAQDIKCLALEFPVMCAETKLDGERMIIHFQNGTVRMHTRNGKWYSGLYSPVLGPAVRRALQNYTVDAIFDGEIMSWDNQKKELVPFGYNRTIANYRRSYMDRNGLLEAIDTKLHEEETDSRVMTNQDDWAVKNADRDENDGKECWLLYCVFDLLYVGGKDATRLLHNDCGLKHVKPGSIIHLTCLERKQVLQRLLSEQEHEIEICKSVVIRPNGDCVPGDEYYGQKVMEHGYERTFLDSTHTAMKRLVTSVEEIDAKQRGHLASNEISVRRAQAVEEFFRTVVEHHRKEGIVIKDLASPYILGEPSRRRKHWFKFKPDYERATGNAVDIDVVILGGTYASGLKHSGKISSFLCGCVDHEDSSSFMTFCNINGASTSFDRLNKLLAHTGFKQATKDSPMELGKWFLSSELPPGEEVPEFISSRSLQRGEEDYNGWKYSKNKNYPDMWINPEDSVVLTIEGQELITTDEYSAGVCLRFPKIIKIRLDEMEGAKAANEVESDRDLWDTYITTIRQREETSKLMESSQFSQSLAMPDRAAVSRRFLTPEEFKSKTKKRKRKAQILPSSKVPKVSAKTKILSGYMFAFLDGKYSLDPESLDAKAAKEEGWYELATNCKGKEHVMEFIQSHGGKVKVGPQVGDKFVLGGRETDARVVHYMKAIRNAREQVRTATTKSKKTEELMRMAESEGVLKWIFVYSIVHRWINERKASVENEEMLPSIKETDPSVLVPKAHHYLTRDALAEIDSIQDIFDLDTSDLTETDFERALLDIAKQFDDFDAPWQNKSFWLGLLNDNEDNSKEMFEKVFWPIDWGVTNRCQVVVFPHVYNDIQIDQVDPKEGLADANSDYWDEVEKEGKLDATSDCVLSTLPLARGMGAIVSSSFNAQVTHIICDLKENIDGIISTSDEAGIGEEIFRDAEKWKCLLPHLKSVVDTNTDVKLVSPAWIRKQWDDHFCT